MSKFPAAVAFVKELGKDTGKLGDLRRILKIEAHSKISKSALSKHKDPPLTYKIEERGPPYFGECLLDGWVVKFSPPNNQDSWYDVRKEYRILRDLKSVGIPVPTPLYCSTLYDKRVIGTDFIVMEFVEGEQFDCVDDIEEYFREDALLSVADFLGNLHQQCWEDENAFSSVNFWKQQITKWSNNFLSASLLKGYDPFYPLFTDVSRLSPPDGDYSIIHGDMTISNVIFDDEYNVKAVIDWKYQRNGDPMVDLSYFCMMFLGREKVLRGVNRLLAGDSVDESDVLERYCESRGIDEVDDSALNFAKSVSCLRMMSIVKAAEVDHFVNHECSQYMDKKLAPKVMKFLETACLQFMEEED